jgi:hypothetical protein
LTCFCGRSGERNVLGGCLPEEAIHPKLEDVADVETLAAVDILPDLEVSPIGNRR